VSTDSTDWRARKRDETHQRIYATAMRLFQENGFEQVNVGQIAAASGVSVPTFYAHFPSKEHIVMQLPTAAEVAAVLMGQPAELPVGERIRRAAPHWFAQWGPDERPELLARWRIVAETPSLRLRAGEFERTTAGLIVQALAEQPGASVRSSDVVVVAAHLAAFTEGLLAWADCNGASEVEDLVDEAFQALRQP
jgi:AcrR family transcriptional regulator